MARLYQLLIFGFYASLFVPITYWFGPVGIPLWALPISGIIFLRFARRSLQGDERIRRFDHYDWAVITFIAVMFISSLISPPMEDLGFNKLVVYSMALLLTLYVRRNWRSLFSTQQLIRFTYVFVAVQALFCIIQFITGQPIGHIGAYIGETQADSVGEVIGISRVVGTLGGSPNMLGRVALVLSPFIVLRAFEKSSSNTLWSYFRTRIWLLLVVLILGLTMSRSALLVFVIMGGIAWWKYMFRDMKTKRITHTTWARLAASYILVASFGGVVVAGSLTSTIRDSVTRSAQATFYRIEQLQEAAIAVEESALGVRAELISEGFTMFSERPLLGNGYRNTKKIAERTDNPIIDWKELRVHNAFVAFLAEGGIIAFLAFLMITIYPIYVTWKGRYFEPENWAFLASCLCIVLVMQVGTTFDTVSNAPVYALIWGGAIGTAKRDLF